MKKMISNNVPMIQSKNGVEDEIDAEEGIDEVEDEMLEERRPTSIKATTFQNDKMPSHPSSRYSDLTAVTGKE